MITTPINNLSPSYFEATLAAQKPSNASSASSSSSGGLSTFAQLLSTSASSNAAGGNSSTNSPNQMLNQVMTSFKNNGIQNEGSSLDPMSVG